MVSFPKFLATHKKRKPHTYILPSAASPLWDAAFLCSKNVEKKNKKSGITLSMVIPLK
jgi:hypothetical protein